MGRLQDHYPQPLLHSCLCKMLFAGGISSRGACGERCRAGAEGSCGPKLCAGFEGTGPVRWEDGAEVGGQARTSSQPTGP